MTSSYSNILMLRQHPSAGYHLGTQAGAEGAWNSLNYLALEWASEAKQARQTPLLSIEGRELGSGWETRLVPKNRQEPGHERAGGEARTWRVYTDVVKHEYGLVPCPSNRVVASSVDLTDPDATEAFVHGSC